MKYLILFTIFFFQITQLTAQIELQGIINTIDNVPISYATISLKNKQVGEMTNEKGMFILSLKEEEKSDTLIFQALGFQSKIITVQDFINQSFTTIMLEKKDYKLPEIVVTNGSKRLIEVGQTVYKKLEKSGVSYGKSRAKNQQFALFIPNENQEKGTFKSVSYFMGSGVFSLSKPKTPFRVRIYENKNGQPGEDLLLENVITSPKKGGKWHTVDISEHNIPFPEEGLFVGMEWIYTTDKRYNHKVTYHYKEDENGKSKKEKVMNFGQTLNAVQLDVGDCNTWFLYGNGDWVKFNFLDADWCIQVLIKGEVEVY